MSDSMVVRVKPEIVCPVCHAALSEGADAVHCTGCQSSFRKSGPFLNLLPCPEPSFEAIPRPYFENERRATARLFDQYLWPHLHREPFSSALDVGCGSGSIVTGLAAKGYAALGVDLESLVPYWIASQLSPAQFFVGDAEQLPFPDHSFDLVLSLGVIEHIGTWDGHSTLAPHYRERRLRFARSLVRVTRPGGRLLISCPNRHFPVDLQHGVEATGARWRHVLFDRTHLNVHATWKETHLLTFGEVRELFVANAGAASIEALPLRNYFGFSLATRVRYLKLGLPLMRAYVDHLPPLLRTTPLNPYVLVQIRK